MEKREVKYYNKKYVNVNKKSARNLFNKGINICLVPCKANINNIFIDLHEINNRDIKTFDEIINCFEVYNCNNELGNYSSYYIEKL